MLLAQEIRAELVGEITMTRIVMPSGIFDAVTPDSEPSFEKAVVANAKNIFGEERYYIDCKRRIGAKGEKKNIPPYLEVK